MEAVEPKPETQSTLRRNLLLVASYLVLMALMPWYMMSIFRVPFYFGGTTLMIVVGVALDTLQQIEANLVMRHYEGLVKGGKFQGRRFG